MNKKSAHPSVSTPDNLRACLRCGEPTRLGRWRCDACQREIDGHPGKRHLRLVELPGVDADSIRRHPSNERPYAVDDAEHRG